MVRILCSGVIIAVATETGRAQTVIDSRSMAGVAGDPDMHSRQRIVRGGMIESAIVPGENVMTGLAVF